MHVVLLVLHLVVAMGVMRVLAGGGRVCPTNCSGCSSETRSEALHGELARDDLFHG